MFHGWTTKENSSLPSLSWVLIVYSQRNKNICICILDTFLFNYASMHDNIYPYFFKFCFKGKSCSSDIYSGILSYKYLQEFVPVKPHKHILKEGSQLYAATRTVTDQAIFWVSHINWLQYSEWGHALSHHSLSFFSSFFFSCCWVLRN